MMLMIAPVLASITIGRRQADASIVLYGETMSPLATPLQAAMFGNRNFPTTENVSGSISAMYEFGAAGTLIIQRWLYGFQAGCSMPVASGNEILARSTLVFA